VVEEAGPDLGIDRRILDRRVGEDQRVGIDELALVGRNVGDQIAVGVGEPAVELEPATAGPASTSVPSSAARDVVTGFIGISRQFGLRVLFVDPPDTPYGTAIALL